MEGTNKKQKGQDGKRTGRVACTTIYTGRMPRGKKRPVHGERPCPPAEVTGRGGGAEKAG